MSQYVKTEREVDVGQFKWNFRMMLQLQYPSGWQISAAEADNSLGVQYNRYFGGRIFYPQDIIPHAKNWEGVINILFKEEVKPRVSGGMKAWKCQEGVTREEMSAIVRHGADYNKAKRPWVHRDPKFNRAEEKYAGRRFYTEDQYQYKGYEHHEGTKTKETGDRETSQKRDKGYRHAPKNSSEATASKGKIPISKDLLTEMPKEKSEEQRTHFERDHQRYTSSRNRSRSPARRY